MTFESHPTPPGLEISQEDVVERLRDMAFRFSEAIANDDDELRVGAYDIDTLNFAISLLGGTPVHLAEISDRRESPEVPF